MAKGKIFQTMGREIGVFVALIAVMVVFSAIDEHYFTMANLIDIVDQSTINGLIAIGMTFVIVTGGIDLSVGSVMAIVIVLVGRLLTEQGMDPISATIVGIILGFTLGSFNGFLITRLKLQPFIATLGTMSVYRGFAYIITSGWPVLNIPQEFRTMLDGDFFSIFRISILILLIFAFITHILIKSTRFGNYVYAIGSNEEATRLSGVSVDFNKLMTYGLCGVGAALAGMVMLARLGTGEPAAGQGYELNAIAAAAIGGTSLAGGKGTIIGTLLGAFLLSALKVGLVVVGVDAFWQYIATGGIIVVAAYFEVLQNKIKGTH
ncbi:ABC transporter permease [uncultured Selenomonas sp.]|uniref:ABC transporter permease n=1 Tax=uncultured Selenomonas sp. TaxID=159275 RepID=UPI0028E9C898|nr:ABC transporter permease [uncultured Selenomonas sp.]